MDQGNLIRLSTSSDADLNEGGVCYALAVRWLGLRRRGLDYDQTYRGLRGFDHVTSVPDAVFSEQVDRLLDVEIWSGGPGQMPRTGMIGITQNLMLARNGLRIVHQESWQPPFDERDLAYYVAETTALYLVSLRGGGGSHAVAVDATRHNSTYRFFDPNYGQFIVRGAAAFVIFLRQFFADTGYGARYTLRMQARRLAPV